MNMHFHPSVLHAASLLVFSLTCSAQSLLHWLPGEAACGPRGVMPAATRWDPDGPGPEPELVVLGGPTLALPNLGARYVVGFDPTSRTWRRLDVEPDGPVFFVKGLSDGRLAMTGSFTSYRGQPVTGLVLTDGTTWTAPPFATSALCVEDFQGDLVVGGTFQSIGGQTITGLARWDGSQWHAFPNIGATVTHLVRRANGNLLVGGSFPTNVAEWNGQYWTSFAPGIGTYPSALCELPNGDIAVSGGPAGVSLWHGGQWQAIGAGLDAGAFGPKVLTPLPNGDLLASPVGALYGAPFVGVARWNGTQWSGYAPGTGPTLALYPEANGELIGAGTLGGAQVWDGAQWDLASRGFNDRVQQLLPIDDQVLACGTFDTVDAQQIFGYAIGDGHSWSAISIPTPAALAGIDTVTGATWIAGQYGIHQWNGGGWSQIASLTGMSSLLVENGALTVGGTFGFGHGDGVAQWSGTQWQTIGAGFDDRPTVLLRRHNGELIAGGNFLNAGGVPVNRIARWNGTQWLPLGNGLDGAVRALTELPDGSLVAAGEFQNDWTLLQPLPLVARWDGTSWTPMGSGLGSTNVLLPRVDVLRALPDGSLLAGGSFELGGAPVGIARWDGSQWTVVDGGVDGDVAALLLRPNGDVMVGGNFANAGGAPSAYFATLRSAAPATATPFGSGCIPATGSPTLTATQLPWLGATYRATCAPLAIGALPIDVYGFSATSLPLIGFVPYGAVSCNLLVQPAVLAMAASGGGESTSSLPVPSAPVLLGASLLHQVLVLELGGGGNPIRLGGSNGITLTVGSL